MFNAGVTQSYVNLYNTMVGKEAVILGSGDIGLIMARRMTLEGAEVKVVAELMPYSGGLKRNIVQCLDDFGIPLKLSHTVVDIKGKERVEGITLAQVDGGKPIPGTEEFYECDTLLLSCGLPLILPAMPNAEGTVPRISNTRVRGHHLGLAGVVARKVPYRFKATFTENFGTYFSPYAAKPWQLSLALEADVTREIIRLSGVPLAAPSANISGKPSTTTAKHVKYDHDGRIDAIVDGGACRVNNSGKSTNLILKAIRFRSDRKRNLYLH